jgi:hypothetical protein
MPKRQSCGCPSNGACCKPVAPSPSNKNTGKKTSPNPAPATNINIDLAAKPPKDTCDIPEERTKLAAADYEFADLHLDQASAQYLKLSKSCDLRTRYDAVYGFQAAHSKMSRWWWQMGHYFPPFRWYNIHYPRFWWVLAVAAAIFLSLLYLPKLRPVRGAASWIAKPTSKLSDLFFDKGFPRAVIMSPTKLTDATEATLFASMLQNSSEEVRRVLQRAGGGLQLRSTTLLSLPSVMTSDLSQSLPNIKGVDLTGFAKFFLYLKRYFATRVESQIGFCPPTKSSDGTTLTPARIIASATLRSAWKVRGGPWPVSHNVEDQYDIDAVAFALAVRIMGSSRDK